jgi:Uma2 family endonuclease
MGDKAMTITTVKWSIEDYHHMIATGLLEGRPVELLNGEIIEMSPEGMPHSSLSTGAKDYLNRLLSDRALVREGHPITLPSHNSEPEPDLAIVQRLEENVEDEYWDHHPYPENIYWLIEFSDSSLKKDLDPKAKAYAAAGILEYWVVNLKSMELVIMRSPLNGEYQAQVIVTQGEVRPLAFPDVAVAVSKLLRTRR